MKVYLSKINESWIIDRMRKEWYEHNSEVSTEKINESDIIWIISPWLWKKIPKRYLKKNKVVCSVYHFEEKDFERDSLKDFYKRDSYVDEYHAISPYIEKDLRNLTTKPITYIPFWVNESIWFNIPDKSNLRKKYNIFIDQDSKPIGGKWNFDKENRKGISYLKSDIPKRLHIKPNKITFDAMVDVEECFPKSPGNLENFNWATSHHEAEQLLDDFIERYLVNYGSFQDAINKNNHFMFHSLLSPYLNSGLLDPLDCIEKVIKKFNSLDDEIPINSVEGFIRQILGWREFIRGVYWENMPQYKNLNLWSHKLKLNNNWYSGETGIPPLDDAIIESRDLAYSHHINRLMVISNLMTLTGIHPNEMYKWFMEMYIDAYDWVMVPNVYGMGSYADGGIFSKKPYICGSSYMLRMSNYSKGDWCDTVDGLYWRFIENNIKFFESNPRLAIMTRSLSKMNKDRKKLIFKKAEEFIDKNTA